LLEFEIGTGEGNRTLVSIHCHKNISLMQSAYFEKIKRRQAARQMYENNPPAHTRAQHQFALSIERLAASGLFPSPKAF
jgi:exopolysaccharide biosynthesis predicted pyruvyltransferase EpsI